MPVSNSEHQDKEPQPLPTCPLAESNICGALEKYVWGGGCHGPCWHQQSFISGKVYDAKPTSALVLPMPPVGFGSLYFEIIIIGYKEKRDELEKDNSKLDYVFWGRIQMHDIDLNELNADTN